jgi:hypothetical protein
MAQSYLIFDFGGNEEAAQAARQKLEGWRHAFRLDRKLTYKFERKEPEKKNGGEKIRIIVRLEFSDHEKLSYHRWLERIPGEDPFKAASPNTIHRGDGEYSATDDLFQSLD